MTPWLRAAEAAEYAKVTKATIFRACRDRRLEHVRVSGRAMVLTKTEWIDAWLNAQIVRVKAVHS